MSADSPTVDLARRLVQAPSPSTRERPAVDVLIAAFEAHGFDRAWIDEAGNAVGVIERGDGPTVMLNGHVDTVPLGDEAAWPHPPLSGDVVDGRLWGRGASDMKSSLACMTVAAAQAAERGFRGTLYVTGVVQEEIGGLGARHLGATIPVDAVVLGEPSKLQFKLGHRGRIEVDVHLPGRIAHAAKPELGENALLRAARFLQALDAAHLPAGGPLGASTATPTSLVSHPEGGRNVVPGEAVVTIDYRNLPDDPPEDVLARLQALDPDATLVVGDAERASESGEVRTTIPGVNPAYLAPGENAYVTRAREVLRRELPARGVAYAEGTWWFATDAPHLAQRGAVVLGFGPGEEEVAHTTRESVSVEHLEIATEVYRELALALLAGEPGA